MCYYYSLPRSCRESCVSIFFFSQPDLYRPDERNNQEILSYKIKSIMQTETGKESWGAKQKKDSWGKLENKNESMYWDEIENLEAEWGVGGTKCGFRHLPSNAEKLDFPLRWLLIHNCCRITGKGTGCKKMDVIGMLFCPLNVFEDSLFEGLGNHFQHLSEMGNPEGFISKTFVQSCQRRQVLSWNVRIRTPKWHLRPTKPPPQSGNATFRMIPGGRMH